MNLQQYVREIPDFPKPGILFRDINPLMHDPKVWGQVVSEFKSICDDLEPDLIVGIESRGFIIGSALATSQGIGFAPIRKAGKLPGKVSGVEYELEYGTDRLEIQVDAFNRQQKVLIVDDLLATGGTANAARELVARTTSTLTGFAFVVELASLNGRNSIKSDLPIKSLIVYD